MIENLSIFHKIEQQNTQFSNNNPSEEGSCQVKSTNCLILLTPIEEWYFIVEYLLRETSQFIPLTGILTISDDTYRFNKIYFWNLISSLTWRLLLCYLFLVCLICLWDGGIMYFRHWNLAEVCTSNILLLSVLLIFGWNRAINLRRKRYPGYYNLLTFTN